ncbi:hypothetical protein [[Phormidium ambiguum] IAM M-71]|uniref:hypothetical protein n=1 Tax=[Phormidium ambiguum] IAM M-71 TaxID=454136 RepID=UPI001160E50C|nr:hypothetical protein [Phormidium ambiguum]
MSASSAILGFIHFGAECFDFWDRVTRSNVNQIFRCRCCGCVSWLRYFLLGNSNDFDRKMANSQFLLLVK